MVEGSDDDGIDEGMERHEKVVRDMRKCQNSKTTLPHSQSG